MSPAQGSVSLKPDVDSSPAWSPDGGTIAYRRVYPSADGPPGVYLISRWGGRPRFITGANFIWPSDLRFSPDGKYLAAAIDLQLAIIDLSTGAVRFPFYTDNWVRYPDWSLDGRFIVYSRNVLVSGEPFDSAGIHIYEPRTGRDWPIVHDGSVVLGTKPRWSPDGQWIAYAEGSAVTVSMVRPDGSSQLTLHTSNDLVDFVRWYARRLTGANGVVFEDYCCGFYFVDVATGAERLTRLHGPYDEFSPDGETFVTIGLQLPESLGVIFTQSVDDFSGASRFQVTRYAPPDGTVPARSSDFPGLPMTSCIEEVEDAWPHSLDGGDLTAGPCLAFRGHGTEVGVRSHESEVLERGAMHAHVAVHRGGGTTARRVPDRLRRRE